MASSMPFSFLRPLALPRPSTLSRFLSTTTTATTAQSIPYHISRTPSKNLPVYILAKRGGNMRLTKLRKIEGNINELRADLQAALGLKENDVVANQLTRQIIIKGHRRPEVTKFLEEKNF